MAKYIPQKGERVKLKDTGNFANIISIGPQRVFSRRNYAVWEYKMWENQLCSIAEGITQYQSLGVRTVHKKNLEKLSKRA